MLNSSAWSRFQERIRGCALKCIVGSGRVQRRTECAQAIFDSHKKPQRVQFSARELFSPRIVCGSRIFYHQIYTHTGSRPAADDKAISKQDEQRRRRAESFTFLLSRITMRFITSFNCIKAIDIIFTARCCPFRPLSAARFVYLTKMDRER